MKTLIPILMMLALTSCVTQKKCNSKFPPSKDTIIIETVRDSIVYKDTTIYIKLPGERVVDSFPIPCPPPPPDYIPRRVFAETSLAKASAWWSYPVIKLELIQKDTTIEKRLDNAVKEAYEWRTKYEKITITPQPVKYIPGIYKAALWLWIGVILAVAGYVAFRLFILKK